MNKGKVRFQTLSSSFIGYGECYHAGAVNTLLTGVRTGCSWENSQPWRSPRGKAKALLELSGGCAVERGRWERGGRLTER